MPSFQHGQAVMICKAIRQSVASTENEASKAQVSPIYAVHALPKAVSCNTKFYVHI